MLCHSLTLLQPLSEPVARGLYVDLVNALEYMHRKGLVHRDVTLENCLFDEYGALEADVDFVVCKTFSRPRCLHAAPCSCVLTWCCSSPRVLRVAPWAHPKQR